MRYSDFKLVETKLDEIPDDGNRGEQDTTQPLEAGPPYPREDIDAVKDMQSKLNDLRYDVGTTGIDGKYGPRTTRAVRAFKQDNDLDGDGTLDSGETDLKCFSDPISVRCTTTITNPSAGKSWTCKLNPAGTACACPAI